MVEDAPRAALARRSRSDLAGLIADAWTDRGWTVASGAASGADLVATREGAYTERLAIVVAEPGTTVDVELLQRAAGIREQEATDLVLVVGTEDVTDAATAIAGPESLNVKVLDGWSLCRVLENQGLLGRVGAASTDDTGGETGGDPSGRTATEGSTTAGAESPETPRPGRGGGGGQGAVGSHSDAAGATETPGGPDGQAAGGGAAPGGEAEPDDREPGSKGAADTETPCPSCGEAIFRPLIEQGLQCPYCEADFE